MLRSIQRPTAASGAGSEETWPSLIARTAPGEAPLLRALAHAPVGDRHRAALALAAAVHRVVLGHREVVRSVHRHADPGVVLVRLGARDVEGARVAGYLLAGGLAVAVRGLLLRQALHVLHHVRREADRLLLRHAGQRHLPQAGTDLRR